MVAGTKEYVGAIDQGTTSTRFVIFNNKGERMSSCQLEHKQYFPKPGWVEHDPMEIIDRTNDAIKGALDSAGIKPESLAAIGITNQRETSVIWNKNTGKPYYNAVVWQDTRTDALCKELAVDGNMDCFRHKVGLPLTTYFSGPKLKWLLDKTPGLRDAADSGDAIFGTIDTWLVWWLTGGPGKGVHVTDVTNASRTMLMNIESLQWSDEMLKVMDIPEQVLPEIRSSSEVYGHTVADGVFGMEIPVSGILGDQQAALFGQTCFEVGEAKNTYGTGCFLLKNTGEKIVHSKSGLLTTVGYKVGDSPAVYALEGSIAMAGSLVQWFKDNMGMISKASEISDLAGKVKDSGGIYFVPAFSGLFAPHWRSDARGLIIGLTHYITKDHIARAVLEATAFQAKEIFEAMEKDSGIELKSLKVDGGMVASELLMQFQADILGLPVIRPAMPETTVLGATYAAGLAVGFWKSYDELHANWSEDKRWESTMDTDKRAKLYKGWKKAVERSYSWMDE